MLKRVIQPDIVVFATGYKQSFPFLSSTSYPSPSSASIRGIFEKSDPSVAFIGFVRPSLGAIPPLSELQAQFWILHLLNALPPRSFFQAAENEIPYHLQRTPSYKIFKPHGVDHESYAYQLAVDMGSAPTFPQVCSEGWKVAFTWAMGPNFNSKFRLVGPWKWDGARDVMRTELWGVVKRSGGVVCEFASFRRE
jgi:dimethylaniline monooxygenase (N-oxide forming)